MTLSLSWSTALGHPTLLIQGLPAYLLSLPLANLSDRLALFPSDLLPGHLPHSDGAGHDGLAPLQPLAGSFSLHGNDLHFTPRFPFLDGLSYSLVLRTASEQQLAHLRRPTAPVTPTTTVLEIYPTCKEVPVNLLKLYIHFSASMSEGHALKHVHVHSASGDHLPDVFLNMSPELWDPTRTRLTLLLDPGRIKRGLVPNQESGYPLTEGDQVTISIDPSYLDARGQLLRAAATHTYRIGPPLRTRLAITPWRLTPPKANTRDPLVVSFDRPLDHALLNHSLAVHFVDSAAQRANVSCIIPSQPSNPRLATHDNAPAPRDQPALPGSISTPPGEMLCSFTPGSLWFPGRYFLHVDPLLEDLAGNNLLRLFDRDLTNPQDTPSARTVFTLPFTCA